MMRWKLKYKKSPESMSSGKKWKSHIRNTKHVIEAALGSLNIMYACKRLCIIEKTLKSALDCSAYYRQNVLINLWEMRHTCLRNLNEIQKAKTFQSKTFFPPSLDISTIYRKKNSINLHTHLCFFYSEN